MYITTKEKKGLLIADYNKETNTTQNKRFYPCKNHLPDDDYRHNYCGDYVDFRKMTKEDRKLLISTYENESKKMKGSVEFDIGQGWDPCTAKLTFGYKNKNQFESVPLEAYCKHCNGLLNEDEFCDPDGGILWMQGYSDRWMCSYPTDGCCDNYDDDDESDSNSDS